MKKLLFVVCIAYVVSSCSLFKRGDKTTGVAADGTTKIELPRLPVGWIDCPLVPSGGEGRPLGTGCLDEPGKPPRNCVVYRFKPGMDKWEVDPSPTPYPEEIADVFGWYHKRLCK